jgi:hypothetical protein
VTVCLSLLTLFIALNRHLTILSLIAIVGGLYFFFIGFRLLARKRLLLTTPTSRIQTALKSAMGLVEVNGAASGPYTLSAPITGKACFLYHTTAWQKRDGKNKEWKKVADETLHLPFFIDDSTGKLLLEPLGADLDLHPDFREEYSPSFSSNASSREADIPPRVSVFLARHGIAPGFRLRVEEWSIKLGDTLFVAGTLTENPGIEVRPFAPRGDSVRNGSDRNHASGQQSTPEIVKLCSGAAPSTAQEMTQQARIAAALNRAGITKPEAWSVAGVPYRPIAVEENLVEEKAVEENAPAKTPTPAKASDFNLNPATVLMKGGDDPALVISFRSQKEFATALAWKSAAMICGGIAITLLGLYVLLERTNLL